MSKINKFIKNYINKISFSILNLNFKNLDKAANTIISTIKKNNNIFVCGNGGSAAIANHYVVDFLKFFKENSIYKPKIYSLTNSIETITAISNDISYDKIFSYQAENLCEKNDLIIIISSSGNSKNIIELINFAKRKKIKTIGFSGFRGGYLKKNSNISIHIKAENYGVSEDSHHLLMHGILQYLIEYFGRKN